MEDGGHNTSTAALSMTNNAKPSSNPTHNDGEPAPTPTSPTAGPARTRSGSTSSSTHRRSMSGSLLSKFSFLRTNTTPEQAGASGTAITERDDGGGDNDDPGPGFRGGSKAMASALQQQQRRTRRRRGSLRKTALLGTRFESKKVNRVNSISGGNNNNNNAVELLRGGEDIRQQHTAKNTMRPFSNSVSTGIGEESRAKAAFDRENNPQWGYINAQQKKPLRRASASVSSRHESGLVRNNNVREEETGTDDEDVILYQRPNNNDDDDENGPAIAATGLQHKHFGTPSSSSDSYYALQANSSTYGTTVHRPPKSSLAAHHTTDIKPTTHAHAHAHTHQKEKIIRDYSETEWWGWIILLVTWLVFVVGMGSCFGVWSWAWDVGETPYAPPELEDDPTLPIVGYYPALIILTAVMSWVWVVVAWVGMKYFKHANISGEDI